MPWWEFRGFWGILQRSLLEKAERLMAEVETAFEAADLPETVNAASALAALVDVREKIYG